MGYGDGSIYQRQRDGRWVAAVDAGFLPSGARRRKTFTGASKAEVRNRMRDWLKEYGDKGSIALNPKLTVKAWCDMWLKARESSIRPRVQESDAGWISKWVVPTIGHRPLAELTAADLRKVDTAMRKADRSTTTIRNVRALLHTALVAARREGYLVPDPVFVTPLPAAAVSDRAALEVADAVTILVTAAHKDAWPPLPPDPTPMTDHGTQLAGRLRTPQQRAAVTAWRTLNTQRTHALNTDATRWLAALLQAMRQGECLGLMWDHVDLERRLIHIEWELQAVPTNCGIPDGLRSQHLEGNWWLLPPKTRAGERIVPIAPMMSDALAAWRDACPASPHNLVWPRPDGRPMTKALDLAAWRGLQAAAGVKKTDLESFVVHEARHTTATLLLATGAPTDEIIGIVGHTSLASTKPYLHRDLSGAREALQAVANVLTAT